MQPRDNDHTIDDHVICFVRFCRLLRLPKQQNGEPSPEMGARLVRLARRDTHIADENGRRPDCARKESI
jgi:hypothetical protein